MSTQPQIWYAHGKSDNVTCMNRDTKWLDNATKPMLIFETVLGPQMAKIRVETRKGVNF